MASNYLKNFTNQEFMNQMELNGHTILIGYCHRIRVNKNMIFIVLRHNNCTVQSIIFRKVSPEAYDTVKDLLNESTIRVEGEIVKADVKSCTVTNYELKVSNITVINSSTEIAFSLDDANNGYNQENEQENEIKNDVDNICETNLTNENMV